MANHGARLPLFNVAREGRLLGVRRVPQPNLDLSRFTYDKGIAVLSGLPPTWPVPTRGISEMRLALRYRSRDALWCHIKEVGTLYLEIVDYPGEWLLDLPMLEQEYLTWLGQMLCLLDGERARWAASWLSRCWIPWLPRTNER